MPKLWELQKKESARAFEAFKTYRDAGPGRSTALVAQVLGKSKSLIDRWSSKHHWVERVRAYDAWLDAKALSEADKRVREMREKHINLAKMAQNKVLDELKRRTEEPNRYRLTNAELMRWLEVSTKLEALAVGEPTGDETIITIARAQSVEEIARALEAEDPDVAERVIARLRQQSLESR